MPACVIRSSSMPFAPVSRARFDRRRSTPLPLRNDMNAAPLENSIREGSSGVRLSAPHAARYARPVARLTELHDEFTRLRDRRGIHQCEVLALTGKNRAEGIGKWREAQVFAEWLRARLHVTRPDAEVIQLPLPALLPDSEELETRLPLAA